MKNQYGTETMIKWSLNGLLDQGAPLALDHLKGDVELTVYLTIFAHLKQGNDEPDKKRAFHRIHSNGRFLTLSVKTNHSDDASFVGIRPNPPYIYRFLESLGLPPTATYT